MRQFIADIRSRDEEGATAAEYVFLLVFIAIVITVGMTALAKGINDNMTSTGGKVGTLAPSATT